MYCPTCAVQMTDDVKFCRSCGADLRIVQDALTGRNPQAIDWNKTWVSEMMMSREERERRQGKTPEVKRLEEIKAGVIVSAVGIGAMIFLYFLLGAVAANASAKESMIVSKVWLAGLVPFLIGLALMFNGMFISKRIVKLKKEQDERLPSAPGISTTHQLPDIETIPVPNYSVTDQTTYRLTPPPPKQDA
jgi:hypothetical protein